MRGFASTACSVKIAGLLYAGSLLGLMRNQGPRWRTSIGPDFRLLLALSHIAAAYFCSLPLRAIAADDWNWVLENSLALNPLALYVLFILGCAGTMTVLCGWLGKMLLDSLKRSEGCTLRSRADM